MNIGEATAAQAVQDHGPSVLSGPSPVGGLVLVGVPGCPRVSPTVSPGDTRASCFRPSGVPGPGVSLKGLPAGDTRGRMPWRDEITQTLNDHGGHRGHPGTLNDTDTK